MQPVTVHSRLLHSTRQRRWPAALVLPLMVCTFTAIAAAQKPVAQLPQVYIDTTWNPPVGGTTWAAHTAAQFTQALNSSQPGDIIVLDAGATYTGNFAVPAKFNPNNQWIYVISSALANLPVGQRVSPANVANMPRIITPNVSADLLLNSGANHWRFAGINMTSNSSYCRRAAIA